MSTSFRYDGQFAQHFEDFGLVEPGQEIVVAPDRVEAYRHRPDMIALDTTLPAPALASEPSEDDKPKRSRSQAQSEKNDESGEAASTPQE